jgi:4-hydroxy-3-methylbut-2-en-1-yl diphosphate synthase IspG/GcpE
MAKKDIEKKTSVRIGISETSQELHFDTSLDAAKVISLANEALSNAKILELKDIKDRVILVPASKISYIEIGDTTEQKVGFTSL